MKLLIDADKIILEESPEMEDHVKATYLLRIKNDDSLFKTADSFAKEQTTGDWEVIPGRPEIHLDRYRGKVAFIPASTL